MNARRALDGSRAALALVMVSLSVACVTPPVGGGSQMFYGTSSMPLSATVTLNVSNRGWSDVVVYVADGATPRRLASIPPLKETRLLLYRGSGNLRLILRPIGSTEGFSPEPVWVGPGSAVELTVQPLLRTSELLVR